MKLSLFLIGLLILLATFVLHATAFHRTLLRTAEKASGWKIDVEGSQIKILRGQFLLSNLSLRNPEGNIRLKTDRFLVDFSPLSILRGKIIFTEVSLDHPTLLIEKRITPRPSSDPVKKLWQVFEGSLLLKSIIFQNIVLRHLTLQTGKDHLFEEVRFRIAPTLFGEIELDGELLGLGGGELSFQTALRREGMKIDSLSFKTPKLTAGLKADWSGSAKKGSLSGSAWLEAPTVLPDPLTTSFKVLVENKKVSLESLTANLKGAVLEANGGLNLEDLIVHAAFTAHDLPLEAIFGKIPGSILGPSRGMAELSGTVSGKIPAAKIEAKAIIHDFRHNSLYARRAEGPVRLQWPVLDFDASVRPGAEDKEQVRVIGAVAFGPLPGFAKLEALPQTIHLVFNNAALVEILPASSLKGNLSGELHLKGVGTQVSGTGHGRVTAASLGKGHVDSLESTIGIEPGGKVSFTGTTFSLARTTVSLPGKIDLEAAEPGIHFWGNPTGTLPIDGHYTPADSRLEVSSKGSYPLEWLELFPDYIRDAEGIATGTLQISGTPENPLFKGSLQPHNGGLTFRGFPEAISNLSGTLSSDGNRLTSNLQGVLENGTFTLTGSARLIGLTLDDFRLAFSGSTLSLSRPGVWHLEFDGDLTLEGTLPAPLLKGKIDILDGRYVKKFLVRELVLKPFEEESAPAAWETRVGPVRLDLSVKNTGDLRVKNNIADILLASDLLVKGTYAQPRITGALTATEGTFHYLGQDFRMTEGRLEFSDPYRSEPYLTLTAEQEVPPTYTIFVGVKGFLSNLEIDLSSSPSLERNDILSLIAFGMTDQEIRQSGKSRQSLTSKIVAEEVSTVLERPVTRATGFDIFRLEASESDTGLLEGPQTLSRLSVGKNVTDRLSLEFKTDLAPETAERTIQANYYLTDNILLKGFRTRTATTEPRYQFNLSLRFRVR